MIKNIKNIKIKICGIRTIQDMQAASDAGASAIGLVFVPNSPRRVSIQEAQAIIKASPAFLIKVGLFANASAELIQDYLKNLNSNLDVLQFHGDENLETNDFCKSFNKPFIKALKIKAEEFFPPLCPSVSPSGLSLPPGERRNPGESKTQDLINKIKNYPDAAGILLDAFDPHQPEVHGGTGKKFNWDLLDLISENLKPLGKNLILAGGLNPENIQEALKISRKNIYAVDVSSGVESTPGVKSPEKIKLFCERVFTIYD